MEDAIENDLLNEIVIMATNYSAIRKSNFKWACEKAMEHREFLITTNSNMTVSIGF